MLILSSSGIARQIRILAEGASHIGTISQGSNISPRWKNQRGIWRYHSSCGENAKPFLEAYDWRDTMEYFA